jgi:hypothetical protein
MRHLTRREKRNVCRAVVGKSEDHVNSPGIDGRVILKWILEVA